MIIRNIIVNIINFSFNCDYVCFLLFVVCFCLYLFVCFVLVLNEGFFFFFIVIIGCYVLMFLVWVDDLKIILYINKWCKLCMFIDFLKILFVYDCDIMVGLV